MFNPHKEEFFYLEYLNYIQTRTKWTYAKYEYYPYEETHLAATDLPKNFVIVGKTPHTR